MKRAFCTSITTLLIACLDAKTNMQGVQEASTKLFDTQVSQIDRNVYWEVRWIEL
jgi:hypothetical protein